MLSHENFHKNSKWIKKLISYPWKFYIAKFHLDNLVRIVTRFDPFLMLFKRNRKSKLDFLNFNLVEIKIFEKLEIFSQRMFGLIHLRSFWIKIDDPGWSIVTNTWLNKVSDKIFKNRTFSSFRSPKFKIFSIFE